MNSWETQYVCREIWRKRHKNRILPAALIFNTTQEIKFTMEGMFIFFGYEIYF